MSRRAFEATAKLKKEVTELVSCGMTQDEIARAVGCTLPTLHKYFRAELDSGAAVRRAEAIGLLFANARKGNVTAQKHLEAMTRAGAAAAAVAAPPAELGKKERRQAAADRVEGVFAPPEPPKLIVNNG